MPPRPTRTGKPDVDRAIDEVMAAMPPKTVLSGARLIENLRLASGQTHRIAHGLGRKLQGWLIVRNDSGNAAGYIYDEQSAHADTDRFLYLRVEGYTPTVTLLVF